MMMKTNCVLSHLSAKTMPIRLLIWQVCAVIGINNLVRFIPVRCLGSVNMVWIKDAMSAGMDGAILLGCQYGDDYQCHFVKGSEIANKRMENIGETLGSLGLEVERVAVSQVAINEYDKIPQIINDFVEEIIEMGPNPFKGF